jgi:hypothetical protein
MKRIACLCLLLAGCMDANHTERMIDESRQQNKTYVELHPNGSVSIKTIEHDGHKWIVGRAYSGGMVLEHHPDCHCKKNQ